MSTREDKVNSVDIDRLRRRLEAARGPEYWRGLEELAGTPEFQRLLQNEFPAQASELMKPVSRRAFLKYMSASIALSGLTACTRQPVERIFPYVKAPEEIVPGKPLYFATVMQHRGFAAGVLVESHMGRPTKVEGNPQHPASLGAAEVFAQASVLELYDPDRSQVVTAAGRISTWEAFISELAVQLEAQRGKQGAGLRLLTETVTSPTLANQLRELLAAFPAAKWHQYEPVNRDAVHDGALLAFGSVVHSQYRFDQADVVLALDADFLVNQPGSLRYARDFISRRREGAEPRQMNRLYVVESTPTLTGAIADHRKAMPASEIGGFARQLARELENRGSKIEDRNPRSSIFDPRFVKALANDLRGHRGSSLIVAGDGQPALVHALAHAMNDTLGNVGRTVIYTDPVEARPVNQTSSLQDLVADMQAGAVDVLVMLGGNPVFSAPADLEFAKHLDKVGFRVHLSLYDDETSAWCHWHIPAQHYLESWSDARAYDGTASIVQPLIAPLYGGKSAHELLSTMNGQTARTAHDIVHDYWNARRGGPDFEKFWQTSLHDGFIAGTALPARRVELKLEAGGGRPEAGGWGVEDRGSKVNNGAASSSILDPRSSSLELRFLPDPTVWDGRFANNGWLQELPKPLTKLTWDNAALVSPKVAERLSLSNEEVVELRLHGRSMRAPIWIMPGLPENTVTVHLGYGRTRAGRVANGIGFNAAALRRTAAPWFDAGVELVKTGERYTLAVTQTHHTMEGRNLVRLGTADEYLEHPDFVRELGEEAEPGLSLYPAEHKYEGNSWGMVVDLNSCIGCNACVTACQSENNIPVVGKEEVTRGREMQWIRIDRYYKGEMDDPEIHHQPLMCMHCENAPCEVVCPVAATVHGPEGLNEMVYNRCVGTRYCSNNCPYKVRRFNFFRYADFDTSSLKLQRNPDVTVRSRGVMEKCTYCVQRINLARIEAKKEDREIRDGELLTACQQTCPTQAIIFGNINDPNSRVAKLKAGNLNYGLLTDLNTHPRTTYLAKLRNPNPELAEERG